jgi:hypothetical protein
MLACRKAKCVLCGPGVQRFEQGQCPWTLPARATARSPTTSVSSANDVRSVGVLSLPLVRRQTATHTVPLVAAADLLIS